MSDNDIKEHDKKLISEITNRQGIDGVVNMLINFIDKKVNEAKTQSLKYHFLSIQNRLQQFVDWYYND